MGGHDCRGPPAWGFPLLGQTAITVLTDQFERLRDGDRFLVRSLFGSEHAGDGPGDKALRHHPSQHDYYNRVAKRRLRRFPRLHQRRAQLLQLRLHQRRAQLLQLRLSDADFNTNSHSYTYAAANYTHCTRALDTRATGRRSVLERRDFPGGRVPQRRTYQ